MADCRKRRRRWRPSRSAKKPRRNYGDIGEARREKRNRGGKEHRACSEHGGQRGNVAERGACRPPESACKIGRGRFQRLRLQHVGARQNPVGQNGANLQPNDDRRPDRRARRRRRCGSRPRRDAGGPRSSARSWSCRRRSGQAARNSLQEPGVLRRHGPSKAGVNALLPRHDGNRSSRQWFRGRESSAQISHDRPYPLIL